ncbi:MAG: DUF2203 domain-containing protein [Bdellovibrionaceae bacterium]|nr:DUF2203 domain-containing protein [Pseudobdellovibrionaceae bacterium]
MDNVVSISQTQRTFTLQQAQELLPVIIHITAESQREVSRMVNRLEAIKYGSTEAAQQLEEDIQTQIDHWQQKLSRLGVHPKGLWLADFDNGRGYYCWKYPESSIRFFHGYQDGFSGRQEIHPESLV